jgi:hypothetical protein
VAVFVIVVPSEVEGALTRTVIGSAVAPFASDAIVQVASEVVFEQLHPVPDAPTTVPPSGVSVTVIPVASSGPLFVTETRYATMSPLETGSGPNPVAESDLEMDRSALDDGSLLKLPAFRKTALS